MGEYSNITDIKARNAAMGNFFFSPDTMRFFNSKVEGGVIGGRYFITSERMELSDPKRFTIRVAKDDGSIEDVGEFRGYLSREDAADALKAALATGQVQVVGDGPPNHYVRQVILGGVLGGLRVGSRNTKAACEELAGQLAGAKV